MNKFLKFIKIKKLLLLVQQDLKVRGYVFGYTY